MKLVHRTPLSRPQGASEQRFDVELWEMSPDRFAVNFRYGRPQTLREGTRTAIPVSRAEADRIFAKLVDDKKLEGYRERPDEAPAEPTPAESGRDPQAQDPRTARMLELLRDPAGSLALPLLSQARERDHPLAVQVAEEDRGDAPHQRAHAQAQARPALDPEEHPREAADARRGARVHRWPLLLFPSSSRFAAVVGFRLAIRAV